MIQDNKSIWMAGAFRDKCDRTILVAEPERVAWGGVEVNVACTSRMNGRIAVVVNAQDTNPRLVSERDLLNARIAAAIVAKRSGWPIRGRRISAYLRYSRSIHVEVDVNVRATLKLIRAHAKAGESPVALRSKPAS